MRFYQLLLAVLALALFAGDSFAGPLQRLRARRAGGCGSPAGATYAHAIPAHSPAFHPGALVPGGCAGGKCPTR